MASSGMSDFLKRWLRQLASLRLAVVVLGLLAAVLAGATFYESVYGTPAVHRDIYKSWWFALILMVLGINVAAATVNRWPWRARHIGFVITHASILLILGGCLTTNWGGVSGRLAIPQGQQEDKVVQDEWQVVVAAGPDSHAPTATIPVNQPPGPGTVRHFTLDGQPCQLRIVQYMADAQSSEQVIAGSESDPPAMLVELQMGGQGMPQWLFVDDSSPRRSLRMPGFVLAAVSRFDLPQAPATMPAGGRNISIVPEQGRMMLYEAQNGQLVQQTELPQETPVALKTARLSLVLKEFLPHARVSTVVTAAAQPSAEPQPAIDVELQGSGVQHRGWLVWGEPRNLAADGTGPRLTFEAKEVALPFAVRLNRFDLEYYPGTQMPSMYRSNVTVLDEKAGEERTVNIEMNRPLQHAGWTFFQSAYSLEGGRRVTILSASRDPGKPIVYLGAILLMIGTVVFSVQRFVALGKMGPRAEARAPENVSVS